MENVVIMRKFFFKFFIVSLLFLWVLGWLTIGTLDLQIVLADKMFKMNARDYTACILMFISIWKLFVIQFTLIPTIALWWLEKSLCKK